MMPFYVQLCLWLIVSGVSWKNQNFVVSERNSFEKKKKIGSLKNIYAVELDIMDSLGLKILFVKSEIFCKIGV